MPEINSIGRKIAQIRESRKLALTQLAERCQLPAELIQEIEGGALIPSLAPLIKIARVLGVRLGTFMDDVENIGLEGCPLCRQIEAVIGGAGLLCPGHGQERAPHGSVPGRYSSRP
jgi:transcriptional regulator with XRE-family HTH domain